MTDQEMNAIIQELSIQRNSMGDRAASLAAELAKANTRIAELEKDKAGSAANVLEMPPRPAA
jgi:hypothetical protein